MNEDDIQELIMEHENELRVEELKELSNEENQETPRRTLSFDRDEQESVSTSVIKQLFKKWEEVRITDSRYRKQADNDRLGDFYN